jgi:thioredoxin 1
MENLNQYDVVYFSTTWCGPCKVSKPIVEKVSNENSVNTRFFTVNEEENGSEIASTFGVKAVPTILFFKNGEEVERRVGAVKEAEFLATVLAHRN